MNNAWAAALSNLKTEISPSSAYDTFIEPLVPVFFDVKTNLFCLQTRAPFIKSIIEERYISIISNSLSAFYDKEISASIMLVEEAEALKESIEESSKEPAVSINQPSVENVNLLKNYTFKNFVIDDKNRFAHAVATAVSKKPGNPSYNPLFLYGSSGLGKTHLLNAIGNAFLENFPKKKLLYVTSEEFTSDFIYASQNNNFPSFKKKYRTVDLLLIDDIQFISSKDKTSEEVFHTFNALHQMKNQLVFSSDRPPSEIIGIDERLSSRLAGGIITAIDPPFVETRIAILKNQLTEKKITPTREFDEIIEFITTRIKNNIRELIGAFNRVIMFFTMSGISPSLTTAKSILNDIVTEETPVTIEQIISSVCMYFNISKTDIKSNKRDASIVFARQIAIFLIRVHTSSSYKKIGQVFGGKDHTTIMHSYEKINSKLSTPKINTSLEAIENSLF